MVVLKFDHRPDDESNAMLTLIEQKATAGSGEVNDPQATVEQIGGHDVTVVRRGDSCTMMSWEQEGVSLSLTNAYDPPGEILYSCEEMRRIVESVEAQ